MRDLVFDVRFLRNPHYEPELRALTGLNDEVGEYVSQDPDFEAFFNSFTDMLKITLPRYATEGKSHLAIAIGCTGGKHRSVFIAEKLTRWIRENTDFPAHVFHVEQEGKTKPDKN